MLRDPHPAHRRDRARRIGLQLADRVADRPRRPHGAMPLAIAAARRRAAGTIQRGKVMPSSRPRETGPAARPTHSAR